MITGNFEISIYEFAGLIGVLFYLGSYAALQLKFIDANSIKYPFFNFIASGCVLFSLMESFNMSSALVNLSWVIISGYGIITMLFSRGKIAEKLIKADMTEA